MDALVELIEAEAVEDLIAYLGSDYWRIRNHSRAVAANLVKSGAGSALMSHFTDAKNPSAQAGILAVLATTKHAAAAALAKEAMKHNSPVVRAQAVRTFAALTGTSCIPDVLSHLIAATDPSDVEGCENALSMFCTDPANAEVLRNAILKTKSSTPPDAQATMFYLLGRIGDPTSLAALKKLAQNDDARMLASVATALSYSPSREADQIMIDLAAASSKRAQIIGPHAVRRMVIGPKGYNDISSSQRMDFADAMLKITLEPRIVQLLASIHEARALTTLMFCLEKGVASAAQSLIANAEGIEKLSPADAKIAAKALQDVIEYIEITRLRGGIKAHMSKDDRYTEWKLLQARAGKVLLKFHKPDAAPIPGFDPLDLE
jgi:hypothetical protein